jgi:hypothetical protein
VGYKVIVRDRGRRDSLHFLFVAGVLGLLPIAVYILDPKTAPASLIFGAVVGLPFFALSLWRLTRMQALGISNDGKSLALFRRTFRGQTRLDIPCVDVEWLGLGGNQLGIGLKGGQTLEFDVEIGRLADPALRDLARQLGIRYASGPDYD